MLRFKALLSLIAVMTIAIMLTGTVQAQNVYRIGLNDCLSQLYAQSGDAALSAAHPQENDDAVEGGEIGDQQGPQ